MTISLLWIMVQHPGELDTVLGHGPGAQVLMSLLQSRGQLFCLSQMLAWQQIWRDWRRPNQQHDAHEFFAHIQDSIGLPGFDGDWEARLDSGGSHLVRDRGTTGQGISISVPRNPDSLSNCIKDWCLQPQKHALVTAPKWLCIHLLRVTNLPNGGSQKLETAIHFQAIIHVPLFDAGNSLSWIPYRIVAGVTHAGPTLQAGHYRGFLSEASPGRGNPHGYRFRITDDDVPSRIASAEQNRILGHQCYMCFLIKVSGEPLQ